MNDGEVTMSNTNGLRFLFRGVENYDPHPTQPVLKAPIVNLAPNNQPLFRLMGKSETISFTFALFNDGTDISLGTHSSTVITVKDQRKYLKSVFWSENYDVGFQIWDRGIEFDQGDNVRGVIEDISCPAKRGAQTIVVGNLRMARGYIGAL